MADVGGDWLGMERGLAPDSGESGRPGIEARVLIGLLLLKKACGCAGAPAARVTLVELLAHSRRRLWQTGRDPARGSACHRPASFRQPPDQAACGGWSRQAAHPGRTRRAS